MHGLIDDEMALIIPKIAPTKWRRFRSRILLVQSKHQNIDELAKDIECQVFKKLQPHLFLMQFLKQLILSIVAVVSLRLFQLKRYAVLQTPRDRMSRCMTA